MQKILLIALGGALGTLSRFGLASAVQRMTGPDFPYGTFAVNMLGSMAFGLVFGFLENRLPLNADLRMVMLTGFMGAFTTFSTYMFESTNLIRNGQWLAATLNLGGQTAIGLLFMIAGLSLARNI